MTEQVLPLAQSGDQGAFAELVEPFRAELQLHCYRILGSAADAEDALQETLMAAWRGLGQFEGRSHVRAWLYRIAINTSLKVLRGSRTRPAPEAARHLPEPTWLGEPLWLEPYPDLLLSDLDEVLRIVGLEDVSRRRSKTRRWPIPR
jgi:RNA polymerase sigma factor (sigma-70 family)